MSEYEIAYLFVDGIAERLRPCAKREPVLVAWGFTVEVRRVRGRVGALGLASSRWILRSIAPTFVCIETFHLERVGTNYF